MTNPRQSESGFTLVEALIAIVILAVGLVAVTNLFVVAAASNQIGNLTTATATEASQTLERLKSLDFLTVLVPPGAPTNQGSLVADTGPANAVPSATTDVFVGGVPPLTYHMYRTIPSLGVIRTRWTIWSCTTCGPTEVAFITVRSEGMSSRVGGQMTRSEFTSWRACTAQGCP